MRRTRAICIIGFLALTGPAPASEKEAKENLERAINAQGGAAALTKTAQLKRSDKGTILIGGKKVPFTSQVVRSLPTRVRIDFEAANGVKTTVVLDGDKGWQSDGGPAFELLTARVKERREEAYVDHATTLVPLRKSDYTLSTLPKKKIDGEEAVGIKVAHKGQPDLRLYFLVRNGLLVRVERQITLAGRKIDKESHFSGYKDFDGVKLPTRESEVVNGTKSVEFTVSDVSFPAKIDAKTFARP
jgi:hypothetical protein